MKKVGLTQAVRSALSHELEREQDQPSELDTWVEFARGFRETADPSKALPADKDFIDSLYEDD